MSEKERYRAALHAASLENDLKMFPAGDQVPIGSRGVALSGGQRARIAMARAAYHFSAAPWLDISQRSICVGRVRSFERFNMIQRSPPSFKGMHFCSITRCCKSVGHY